MTIGTRVRVTASWSMFQKKLGVVVGLGVSPEGTYALVDMDEGGEGLRFGFGELEELGPRAA